MSSDARIAANQANARLSTGPRTPEGKANSSQNARQHGLNSHVILPADQPLFDALAAELRQAVQPQGILEETFFEQLLSARWNLLRVSRLQAELLHQSDGLDPLAHPETEKKANLYLRYQLRFEAAYRRALRELKALQTQRGLQQPPEQTPPPLLDPTALAKTAERTQRTRLQQARAELLAVQKEQIQLQTILLELQSGLAAPNTTPSKP